MPVSMLVLYLVVKGVIYPKESKKERERRSSGSSGGPLDLMPGASNWQVVDAICDKINSADLFCGTYSHDFFAYARASIDGVSGNTFTIRVRYSIYSSPSDRSTPNASEDRDLRNDAYKQSISTSQPSCPRKCTVACSPNGNNTSGKWRASPTVACFPI